MVCFLDQVLNLKLLSWSFIPISCLLQEATCYVLKTKSMKRVIWQTTKFFLTKILQTLASKELERSCPGLPKLSLQITVMSLDHPEPKQLTPIPRIVIHKNSGIICVCYFDLLKLTKRTNLYLYPKSKILSEKVQDCL